MTAPSIISVAIPSLPYSREFESLVTSTFTLLLMAATARNNRTSLFRLPLTFDKAAAFISVRLEVSMDRTMLQGVAALLCCALGGLTHAQVIATKRVASGL